MRSVAVNLLHRDSDCTVLDERSSRSTTPTSSSKTDKIGLKRQNSGLLSSPENYSTTKVTSVQTHSTKRKRRRPSVAATASSNPTSTPFITSTGKVMRAKPGPKPKNRSKSVVAVKSARLLSKIEPKQSVVKEKKPVAFVELKPKSVVSSSNLQYHHFNPFLYAQTRGKTNPPIDIKTTFFKKDLLTSEQEKAKYHNGFIHAPTFTPTEEEFKDPAAYIAKITPVGQKFGILKVKPPSSWSVNYAFDPEVGFFYFNFFFQMLTFGKMTNITAFLVQT